MISFIWGLFLTLFIFCACYCFCSVIINAFSKKQNSRESVEQTPSIPPSPPKPTVYYVTSAPKRKRKRPKSNNIGLKGALLPSGTVVIANPEVLKKHAPKTKPPLQTEKSIADRSSQTSAKNSAKSTPTKSSAKSAPTKNPSKSTSTKNPSKSTGSKTSTRRKSSKTSIL